MINTKVRMVATFEGGGIGMVSRRDIQKLLRQSGVGEHTWFIQRVHTWFISYIFWACVCFYFF